MSSLSRFNSDQHTNYIKIRKENTKLLSYSWSHAMFIEIIGLLLAWGYWRIVSKKPKNVTFRLINWLHPGFLSNSFQGHIQFNTLKWLHLTEILSSVFNLPYNDSSLTIAERSWQKKDNKNQHITVNNDKFPLPFHLMYELTRLSTERMSLT